MSTMTDLGESLVAAYLRHVRRCEVVLTNVYIEGTQGELDVVVVVLASDAESRSSRSRAAPR